MSSQTYLLGIDLLQFSNTAFKNSNSGPGFCITAGGDPDARERRSDGAGWGVLGPTHWASWEPGQSPLPLLVWVLLKVCCAPWLGSLRCPLAAASEQPAGRRQQVPRTMTADASPLTPWPLPCKHLPLHPVATQPAQRCCLSSVVSIHALHVIKPEVLIPDSMWAE